MADSAPPMPAALDALDALAPMLGPAFAPLFSLWGSPVTAIEVAAFAMSIAMVLCNWRVHPAGWPLAILSSLAYAALFAQYRLYGEAGLQFVFVALAGWGWWQWLRGRGGDGRALRVHRLSTRQRWQAVAAVALLWPLIAAALIRYTDSDVPWLDALPTAGSVVAQVLLGRKLVENWAVWVAVNLVSVALFATKGLWLTVVLYALFTVMAAVGWRLWDRQLSATPSAAHC